MSAMKSALRDQSASRLGRVRESRTRDVNIAVNPDVGRHTAMSGIWTRSGQSDHPTIEAFGEKEPEA